MDRGAWWAAVYGVAQSWTQLKRLSSSSIPYNHMDYTVHGILQARILEGRRSLFQGIFPIQGSSPGLWHCRQILYQQNQ